MWFAVHVKPGAEAQAVEMLRATPKSGLLDEVFCPMAECQVKDHGVLQDGLRPMFEGIVFVVAPGKRELRACTRRAAGIEAVYDRTPGFEALRPGEERFVDLWAGPGERICPISEGWIDKSGYLNLEAGPLFERQGDIGKLSGNRRWAYMDTSIAGKPARAVAGVRITRNDHLRPWER